MSQINKIWSDFDNELDAPMHEHFTSNTNDVHTTPMKVKKHHHLVKPLLNISGTTNNILLKKQDGQDLINTSTQALYYKNNIAELNTPEDNENNKLAKSKHRRGRKNIDYEFDDSYDNNYEYNYGWQNYSPNIISYPITFPNNISTPLNNPEKTLPSQTNIVRETHGEYQIQLLILLSVIILLFVIFMYLLYQTIKK